MRPAQHCRFGLRRTLIVAGGEKWPNVVERRRRRPRDEEEERRGDGGGGLAGLLGMGGRRNEDAKAFRSANLAPFNGVDGLLLLPSLPRKKC